MSQTPKLRRWPARLASLVLSIMLGLGIAELGFRLFWLKTLTIGAGIEDPHFHHRLKPNEVYDFRSKEFNASTRTNRYGLRGPDPAIPKPAGVMRILMLGDSFTFGFPVKDDETFCSLIERGLWAQGYPVEVINGGVSGYAPTLEYILLRDQLLAFEPDLVILWYDRGDLQEDYWFQKNLIYDDAGRIVRCDPRYVYGRYDWWGQLQNRSALAKYIQVKLIRTFDKIRILGLGGYLKCVLRGERSKVAIARLKSTQQPDDLPAYDRFFLLRETSTPELLERYWSLSARYLRMIHDLLAQHGIPFVLGSHPYGVTVGPDQWAEGRTFWGFERGKVYDSSNARGLYVHFGEEEHIPVIMTFPSFQAAARTEKLYYDWDGHMTPAGHRVLASHVLHDPTFMALVRQHVAHRSQVTRLVSDTRSGMR